MADQFNDLLQRYMLRFRTEPLMVAGVDDEVIAELMQEAIDKGRPIPEEDYYRHLPRGAVA